MVEVGRVSEIKVQGDVDNSIGIGDLAALVTAAGVTIYVLGLIGLAIPIHIRHTGDMSAALIVRILLPSPPLYPAVILLVIYATIVVSRGARDLEGKLGFFWRLLLYVAAGIGCALVAFALLNLTAPPMDTTSWLLTENRFSIGMIFLFVGNFFLAIPAAVAVRPPLPRVRITKQSEVTMEGLPNPLEGRLVTHRDGFWHLFGENNELLSIPDDKVLVVRMLAGEAASPADTKYQEDTKPGKEKTR